MKRIRLLFLMLLCAAGTVSDGSGAESDVELPGCQTRTGVRADHRADGLHVLLCASDGQSRQDREHCRQGCRRAAGPETTAGGRQGRDRDPRRAPSILPPPSASGRPAARAQPVDAVVQRRRGAACGRRCGDRQGHDPRCEFGSRRLVCRSTTWRAMPCCRSRRWDTPPPRSRSATARSSRSN